MKWKNPKKSGKIRYENDVVGVSALIVRRGVSDVAVLLLLRTSDKGSDPYCMLEI